MGLFSDLEVEDLGQVEDKVGGFARIDKTGLYDFEITKAYGGTSSGGAISIDLELKADNGATLRVTEWISSGTKKGCKNYYIDSKGVKQYLPSYNKIKNLDALLTGTEKQYPNSKAGTVMLWDRDEKKELPVEKEILHDFIGKKVSALVMRRLEDASKKVGDDYVPTDVIREVFNIEHFLDYKTKQTRNEVVAGLSGFSEKWLSKFNENYIQDKRDKSKHLDIDDADSYKFDRTSSDTDNTSDTEESPF